MIELIEVNINNNAHIQTLYTLLKNKRFNISNERIPSFNDHLEFVQNCKYRKWYLASKSSKVFGSVYLTYDNIIGINVLSNDTHEYIDIIKLIINNHNPLSPIASIRSKYFLVNVKPTNLSLIKALRTLGMEHIQNTYAFKSLL